MCGIVGIYHHNSISDQQIQACKKGLNFLKRRGPDNQQISHNTNVVLGHSRLSIIDTSSDGNQPMKDPEGKLLISYNGEFYNYQTEKKILLDKGYKFDNKTDTEVLLQMYKEYGVEFIKRVNGCFALSIYDVKNGILFVARDRFGIKPLYYSEENHQFRFASEIKALIPFYNKLELDDIGLHQYFRFNYNPLERTCLKGIKKIEPGFYYLINKENIEKHQYYSISYTKEYSTDNYQEAQKKIVDLTEEAVLKRMVSDVPLGTFLSGGIDSSIISTIAKRHKNDLNTFSIGYVDEPLFDETKYAELVAKKIGSKHHSFQISNKDLFDHLFDVLDYLDEPFADSSALPVYILSKKTRQHVKVALSGDGADEIFSGYNKHLAHYKALNPQFREILIKHSGSFANLFPKGRNSKFSNLARQISKFHKGINLNEKERYIAWLSINNSNYAQELLKTKVNTQTINKYNNQLSKFIENDFNDILYSDTQFLLPNDMLYKVDKMSMANSLEVRAPFLDHELVDYVFSLNSKYKINHRQKKRILQDSFRGILPVELYNKPKHGFEVPLLNWFKGDLQHYLFEDLFRKDKIIRQNILNFEVIDSLKKKLFSSNPEDVVASVWALLVFQYWYDKHFDK